MKIPAQTTTVGGYVYRKSDNFLLGKIGKDATGALYGVPSHRKPSSVIDRVYGTRQEIVVQLIQRAEQWDRLTK